MRAAILRTTFLGLLAAALAVAVYAALTRAERIRVRGEIEALEREMAARIAERDEMIDRLGRSRRIAHLLVGPQSIGPDGRVLETSLELIELDEAGSELDRRGFRVPGRVIYLDGLTVRFDPEDVAAGHPLRGRTLVLLRRIFSDRMPPAEGIPIDLPGARPPGYAAGELGRWEQQLWTHFWDVATDARLAESMGVRVAQGEAVYKPVRTGERYELAVEALGGLTLRPLPATEARVAVDAEPR